ncbi:MAG: hypothetical protein IH608_03415, partial [Proteobacteria bacterium]|nr:hypothetical protein [Pseudomonadota bacterium]
MVLLTLAVLSAAGCATPVGVARVGLREAYREINITALGQRELSDDTKDVLHRYDLSARFAKDPAGVLALLREKSLGEDDRRDLRFALAELSFLYADYLGESIDPEEHRRAPDYFLASAENAYAYLLGDSREAPPGPDDRRFRVACDLYNRALGKALATGKDGQIELRGGVRELPAGPLALSVDTQALPWPLETFTTFLLADDYSVWGLTVRSRSPGLGVPLIAVPRATAEEPRGMPVPLTAFLRVSREPGANGAHRFTGSLELYSAYDEPAVEVVGRNVPLETDLTAPLAYALDDPFVWKAGVRRFLHLQDRVEPGIRLVQPYQPGRIPVVFVHGTASSAVWWAEMLNTLRADPVLRQRCQFWFFQYNSGVPVLVSAAQLRASLTTLLQRLDPEGKDPALRQMAVIGHSQGGLLTKLTAVHTGDRLWRSLSDQSLDEVPLDPAVRADLREYFFVEPLPFVRRVVFISTPHRGSFRASNAVRNLVRKLMSLPANLVKETSQLLSLGDRLKLPPQLRQTPTSVDSMSPENPVLQALAATPLAPVVTAHSIIPVLGEGDYREGNDGVVE